MTKSNPHFPDKEIGARKADFLDTRCMRVVVIKLLQKFDGLWELEAQLSLVAEGV